MPQAASHSPLTTLSSFCDTLEAEDLPFKFLKSTPEHPFEELLVHLGHNDKQHPFTIGLHFMNDAALLANPPLESKDEVYFLSFFLLLPYKVKEQDITLIARLLLLINRLLPIGAFGLDEEGQKLFFQYQLALKEKAFEASVALEIIELSGFLMSEFSPKLEACLKGELTYEAYAKALKEDSLLQAL